MRKHTDKTVYEAALERIAYCFNSFENVLVSFSGGKDSGVLFNLCYEYAKENNLLHKLAIYHLDYEAQYTYTTEYVTNTFESLKDIRRFWLCLPVGANCGCKLDSDIWIPWNKADKKVWCRSMPRFDYVINEDNSPFKVTAGDDDYAIQDCFSAWFESEYGSTAVMIGIRADESPDRQRLITLQGWKPSPHKIYPIYDWKTTDIWVANKKFNYEYNKIYDLFYQAGLNINQMRVANPFHACGLDNLKLYRAIEPKIWGKLLNRVNGVNFGSIYGGTSAVAYRELTKPKHFTWEQYAKFLMDTNPQPAHHEKIYQFVAKWKQQGYPDGIPDEADNQMEKKRDVPSWRRVCACLLKNDFTFTGLGFSKVKPAAYHMIKKINLGIK